MPEISPKPPTGVITYFEPFVDTSTITELDPKPPTGVITYFEPFVDTSTITELDPKPPTGVITAFSPLGALRIKVNGTFKFADASIKTGGIFEPGEIEQLPI